MILEESLNHPSYKSGSSNDESFIYSAFINSVIMDDKDTERIRMSIFYLPLPYSKIFSLSQAYTTPMLTPHVSESSTSEYSDLEVFYFI